MPLDHLFHLSPRLEAKLKSAEGKTFRETCWPFVDTAFTQLLDQVPGDWKEELRLDALGAFCAIDSAFLDLERDEDFHDFEPGASAERTAAALCAWLASMRPVHSRSDFSTDPLLTYLNSALALWSSWLLCDALKKLAGENGPDIDLGTAQVHRREHVAEIIYTLTWRRPSYSQIGSLFKVADFF